MVEYLDSGMPRILKAYPREAYAFDAHFIRITLPMSEAALRLEQEMAREPQGSPSREGLVERLAEGLVKSQREILRLVAENPQISKRAMAEQIGISTTAVDKNINALKNNGFLRRVGANKGGRWEVVGDSLASGES